MVKFDELVTPKKVKILKKICSFLNVLFTKKLLIPTINGVKVKPNSSHSHNIEKFHNNEKLDFDILQERYIPNKKIYNQIMKKINLYKL